MGFDMADHIDVAHYQAELALQHLAVSKWFLTSAQRSTHLRYAEEHLAKCAASLGFDLVPRQTVDEKALEMHFSDGALPVTDKPGFDGRDNSSIDDNVWSR